MVGQCLNSSFNPFAQDYTGKNCIDYATPFRDVNGENIRQLIETAQTQWRAQLSEDAIAERTVLPSPFPVQFQDFYDDVQRIHQGVTG